MDEYIEKICELSFHGMDYLMKVISKVDTLSIELEQKETGDIWKNTFSSNYIEEITQKTGNFKKYSVFVKMLLSAVNKNSESVILDVLTNQDLEALRNRKQEKPSIGENSLRPNKGKRYLIMSYLVEFDKIHYPLPLLYEDNPSVEDLKTTIRRLRFEIEELKQKPSTNTMNFIENNTTTATHLQMQIATLKTENEQLKEKLKGFFETSQQKAGAVELDRTLEQELENLKNEYVGRISRLEEEGARKDKELLEIKKELSHLKFKMASTSKAKSEEENAYHEELMKQNEQLEFELQESHKVENKLQREIERLHKEIEAGKNIDKKQKQRIQQLENDLEVQQTTKTIRQL